MKMLISRHKNNEFFLHKPGDNELCSLKEAFFLNKIDFGEEFFLAHLRNYETQSHQNLCIFVVTSRMDLSDQSIFNKSVLEASEDCWFKKSLLYIKSMYNTVYIVNHNTLMTVDFWEILASPD